MYPSIEIEEQNPKQIQYSPPTPTSKTPMSEKS